MTSVNGPNAASWHYGTANGSRTTLPFTGNQLLEPPLAPGGERGANWLGDAASVRHSRPHDVGRWTNYGLSRDGVDDALVLLVSDERAPSG